MQIPIPRRSRSPRRGPSRGARIGLGVAFAGIAASGAAAALLTLGGAGTAPGTAPAEPAGSASVPAVDVPAATGSSTRIVPVNAWGCADGSDEDEQGYCADGSVSAPLEPQPQQLCPYNDQSNGDGLCYDGYEVYQLPPGATINEDGSISAPAQGPTGSGPSDPSDDWNS